MISTFMLFVTVLVVWDAIWRMNDADLKDLKQQAIMKQIDENSPND